MALIIDINDRISTGVSGVGYVFGAIFLRLAFMSCFEQLDNVRAVIYHDRLCTQLVGA